MRTLYPAIHPHNTFMLKVDEPHEIYVEECGNPDGLPVLFIHGGPGAGCMETDRCFFDPSRYRIILFDQRGCGRSTPHACLDKNTSQHLIEDIELIRKKLGVDKWLVFGGSWGSTLSLAYAQAHPEYVQMLIVRGIFLATKAEVRWFYGGLGAANVFPEHYESFVAPIPEQERGDIINAYYKQLTSDNEIKRLTAAKAWSTWEGNTLSLEPNPKLIDYFSSPHVALSTARIECHYFKNDSFFKPNQLLNDMNRLADIPGVIVHGRYDMICSAKIAWQLHKAWPQSTLYFVRDAGHSSREQGITDMLVRTTDEFADANF